MTARRKTRDRAKSQAYRERLRAKGLRPVQHWVPDTRSPDFRERARRQCEALNRDPTESEILDEVEAFAADLLKDLPQ